MVDVITDDERRTLLAEQTLLERVSELATCPGRLRRTDLDDALRGVDLPLPPVARRPRLLPRPRVGPGAGV